MNSLEREFKKLLQDDLNERFLTAQTDLNTPVTPEMATDLHEIGVLRGYMKALKEIYQSCDDIMNKLTEPEKKS